MGPYTYRGGANQISILKQALFSESRGVRSIDIENSTLIIDANRAADAQTQCVQYAKIASAVSTRLTSVAMTDLQDGDGKVTFCPVAIHAKYDGDDTQTGSASHRHAADMPDQPAVERTLRADMDKQSLYLDALSFGTNELWVYYDNGHYWHESEAAGRLARLLMADAPPTIEVFHLIPTTRRHAYAGDYDLAQRARTHGAGTRLSRGSR